jgi:acyl carrier protein
VDRQAIFQDVVEIIRSIDSRVNHEAFRLDDTAFHSYGIESLTLIRMAGGLEDRFGIIITDADAFTASSFQRLVDLVLGKLVSPG